MLQMHQNYIVKRVNHISYPSPFISIILSLDYSNRYAVITPAEKIPVNAPKNLATCLTISSSKQRGPLYSSNTFQIFERLSQSPQYAIERLFFPIFALAPC